MGKSQQRFTIIQGDPWTINGENSPARTPVEALEQVHEMATDFPVTIDVQAGETSFALRMDQRGRTAPIEEESISDEDSDDAAELVPSLEEGDEEDIEQPSSRGKIKTKRIALPVLALLLIGASAFGFQKVTTSAQDTSAKSPADSSKGEEDTSWDIQSSEQPLSVINSVIVTVDNDHIRLRQGNSGKQIGEYTTDDPKSIRTIAGKNAAGIDTGSGQVLMIKHDKVTEVDGTMNARGSEPVAVKDDTYTTAESKTGKADKNQAVFAATSKGAVLAQQPNKITVGKEGPVELEAPTQGAKISQWVQVTETQAIVAWAKDDKTWLTVHSNTDGTIESKDEITEKPKVTNGIVWIGSDQYLGPDGLTRLCDGGEQIGSEVMCPDGNHWASADQKITSDSKPTAISDQYTITDKHVTKTESRRNKS